MGKFLKFVTVILYLGVIAGLAFSCVGLLGFTASFFFDLDREIYRDIVAKGIDIFIPAMVVIMWNER